MIEIEELAYQCRRCKVTFLVPRKIFWAEKPGQTKPVPDEVEQEKQTVMHLCHAEERDAFEWGIADLVGVDV